MYKYLFPERIDILENMKIRFTQTTSLNDPFESFPGTFVAKPKEWYKKKYEEEIRNEMKLHPHLKEVEKKRFLRSRRKLFPKYYHDCTDKKTLEKLAYEVQKMSGTVSGVLSLSQNCDNILMWSHYACSHLGFVIEFDYNHEYFFGKVHPVIYSEERPEMDLTESRQNGDLFYIKSKDWAYENEIRMFQYFVKPLKMKNGNDFLPYTNNDSLKEIDLGIKLFKFPKEAIKSITFGWKMAENNIKKVLRIIEDENMSWVKLFNAIPDERLFKMKILPYKKT